MPSLLYAISRLREEDIPTLLSVPGLIEGLVANVLPPLAKIFFFRTLFTGSGPFVERLFDDWTEPSTKPVVKEALDALVRTRIWRIERVNADTQYYFLCDAQRKFIYRLTDTDRGDIPLASNISPTDLWAYARKKWANFEKACLSEDADLIRIVQEGSPWKWLMQSRQKQLWNLLVMYFERHNFLLAALMTIAALMPLKLGETVPVERRNCKSLSFLNRLGIVMFDKSIENYAITPLCLALFRADMDLAVTRNDLSETPTSCFAVKEDAARGFKESCDGIFVESNFRVFSYSQDETTRKILRTFCVLDKDIADALIIGTITMDSVLNAFEANITAENIICFLETHRHKQCEIIPTNVKMQLDLWEQDRASITIERNAMQ